MKRNEFESLPDADKVKLLYEQGVYIGKSVKDGLLAVLYQLDGFYVEVFYKSYRKIIHHIYSFDSAENIDPYLEDGKGLGV